MSEIDLAHLLQGRVEAHPDRTVAHYLKDGEKSAGILTFAQLWERSAGIAQRLREQFEPGERIGILHDKPHEFLCCFFGCQLAGLIAVPLPSVGRKDQQHTRANRFLTDAGAAAVLVDARHGSEPDSTFVCPHILSDSIGPATQRGTLPVRRAGGDLAYLQYTSGSTGNPKGVCITHSNVLANFRQIVQRLRLPEGLSIVSWLPHHHDQGLVGNLLLAVYLGGTCHAMTPGSFVARPLRWLEAISRYRAHLSGGPNFAYDLCTRAANQSGVPRDLDLSTWQVAFNGAERVANSTLQQFSTCFEPYGFHRAAWSPSYGLAEATVAVSMVPPASALPIVEREGTVHVACGMPMDGTEVAIVDAETGESRESGGVGEIWVRGPSVATRYWNHEMPTGRLRGETGADDSLPYLRTGDFGFLEAGQLVIAGRREDRFKIRGRNVFAADLERACRLAAPGISDCAAFMTAIDPWPHLAVELRRASTDKEHLPTLAETLMQAVHRECDILPSAIHFVRQGALPRTTSGKLRRAECANLLLSSRIETLAVHSSATTSSASAHGGSDPVLNNLREMLRSLQLTEICDLDAGADVRLDSLDQLRAQHAMETTFGVRAMIFGTTTTLRDVCEVIRSAESAEPVTTTLLRSPGELSDLQRDIFIADRLCDSALFTVGCIVRVEGEISLATLRAAFDTLLQRHPILASGVVEQAGVLVHSMSPDTLFLEDLSASPQGEREVIEKWFATPLTLGPRAPIRGGVYRREGISRILVAAHHIVADHASMALIAQQLQMHFRAPLTRLPEPLPYRAFADQQAEIVRTQGAMLKDFWSNRLRDLVDPPLLNRAARQPIQEWGVHRVTRALSSDVLASIKGCAQQSGATIGNVVLAAFGLLVMRYGASSRTTVGCVVSLRDTPQSMSTIGYMVNSVPVGIHLDAATCFADLCRRVRNELDAAKAAAAYPQHLIGRELTTHVDADPISPLARYVLNVLDVRHGPDQNVEARASHPLAELQLTVRIGASQLVLEVSALAARYPQPLLDQFAEGLVHLLTRSLADADTHLLDIDVLSQSQQQTVESYQGPALALRRQRLDELIYAQPLEDADSVAVMAPDEEGLWEHLTYSALRERANSLAATLPSVRGTPVAVVMDRSVDQIISIVGILRAGGIYLPIDPQLPTARIRLVLEDSGCRCALIDESQAARLDDCGVPLIRYSYVKSGVPRVLPGGSDQEPATLIYTSGSTGRPKGVLLPHAAHAARLQAMQVELRIGPEDVFVQKTSISFDVSIWEIFLPLVSGARLVIAPRAASFDPELLTRVLAGAGVSIVHFVPTMLREWLASGDASTVARSLKRCLCSGEPLRAEHRDLFSHLLPTTQLVNLYGPTECGIDVTWSTDLGATEDPPIGRPTANSRISIVVDHQELPPNVPGQLIIAGPQLAFGYWGRPDLTAERFVPALHGQPGERAYLSGDHAQWRLDGQLSYLGRTDRQVKVRGVRIELDEVRLALLSHPGVEQAEVFVLGPVDERSLAAAVLSPQQLPASQLQEHVSARLPASAVPTSIRVLTSFPVLASGKCDIGQLKALLVASPDATVISQPMISQAVAQAWHAVLGATPEPGARFFAAGGDSIKAIRLVNELAQRGIGASVADIYRFQNIDEQSRRFTALAPAPADAEEYQPFSLLDATARRAIADDTLEDAYPLSMLQRTIVLHSFGGSRYETYVSGVRLRGRFVADAFEAAVARVMQSHPFLRSSFDLTRTSEPLQLVHAQAMPSIVVRDLRSLAEKAARQDIEQWTRVELSNVFAWQEAPLLRFTVHLLGDDEFVVSMTDAALDGWCVALTFVDLIAGYDARVAGMTPAPLPRLPGYGAFVQLEREAMASAETRRFWRERLQSLTPQQIPRWGVPGAAGGHRRNEIPVPADIVQALQGLANEQGHSIKHVFLALYAVMLAMLRQRDDVIVMIECNGRPECAGGDQMIGVFNNIVPVPVCVRGRTWAQLATELFELETQWQPHRRLPVAEILREQGSRSLGDALFVFTHFHVLDSLRELLHVEVLDVWASDETYLPLTFHVNTSAWHGTRILLDYDEAELPVEQMEWIAGWLDEKLRTLTRNFGAPCAPRPADMNDAVQRYWAAQGGTVVDRVLEQSQRHPRLVAMTEGPCSIPYETLVQRAFGHAHTLRASGVRPGDSIGLVANAGIDAACTMLGAWFAGAYCVLIDPDQPLRRIEAMLVNAGVTVAWIDERHRPQLDARIRQLDFEPDVAAMKSGAPPPVVIHPTQTAYILHTSGSTGTPKSVAVSHAALTHYIANALRLYGIGPRQRVWNHSSIGFDFTLTTLIAPLCAGAHVTCVGRHDLPAMLRDAVGADLIKLTPTHLQLLRRLPDLDPARLPTRMIVGGELLYVKDVQGVRQMNPALRIFNEYGPTEACVGCSVQEHDGGGQHAIEGIGAPVEGMQVHLLDGNLTQIVTDEIGEIYLSGTGLATGYLGLADRTAERFVPCPFGPPGARMYRTGDAAQLVAGRIVCIGRIDRQVKVRGHRVELGEIESCLSDCAEVARAAAAVREGRVVAWILPHQPLDALRTHLIRLHLEEHLPEYMRPERIYALASVPLTAHGKIDAVALREEGELVLPAPMSLVEWIGGLSDEDASRALRQVQLRRAS